MQCALTPSIFVLFFYQIYCFSIRLSDPNCPNVTKTNEMKDKKSGLYVSVTNQSEGLYNLYLVNCARGKSRILVSLETWVTEINKGNDYLSAGEKVRHNINNSYTMLRRGTENNTDQTFDLK